MGPGNATGAHDSPPRVVLSCTARPEECARESAPKRKPSASSAVRWEPSRIQAACVLPARRRMSVAGLLV
jgi:hypothetical protein